MVERSGVNEALEKMGDDIKIVDVGGGKQHIEKEIIEANPDKEIKTVGRYIGLCLRKSF